MLGCKRKTIRIIDYKMITGPHSCNTNHLLTTPLLQKILPLPLIPERRRIEQYGFSPSLEDVQVLLFEYAEQKIGLA